MSESVCVSQYVRVWTYSVASHGSKDVFVGNIPVELHAKQRLAVLLLPTRAVRLTVAHWSRGKVLTLTL